MHTPAGEPCISSASPFNWDEKETETVMEKNVWLFKCKLGAKDVFAILKDEGHRGPNGSRRVFSEFSFWRVDGGYTTSILLCANTSPCGNGSNSQSTTSSDRVEKRKRDSRAQMALQQAPQQLRRLDTAESASDSVSDVPARLPPPEGGSALPFQQLPDGGLGAESASRQQSASMEHEHDSAYSTTSLSQRRQAHHVEGEPTTSQTLANRPRTSPSVNNTFMSGPDFTTRFRLWLTVGWSDARKVVFLNGTMTIKDVFTSIETKLARVLDGKPVAGLRLWLGDRQTDAEQYIDIDVDDEDGWETVLDYARENKALEMHGSVIRQD